ncbi:single-stranded DNA-binding protein [Patescibacteria group bacterium]|nr:single-stranded DNA-binding protein [Patescibacteria group bacterium]MBU1931673.1 single-stranded DNA-binding protein [Patescibacteria group bacterium]
MASRSLNKVMLIGNLTRDPELRYTPQGTAVCSFGLATNRSWQSAGGGDRQEETEFHRIVAWQKLAELCSQLLFKGRKVYVEGRLQTRKWTGSDGQERQTTEIVIDNMIVLDYRQRDDQSGGGYDSTGSQPAVATEVVQPAAPAEPISSEVPVKESKAKAVVKPKTQKKVETVGQDDPKKVAPDDIPF